VTQLTGAIGAAFCIVYISMFASGGVLRYWGKETHPRLNPTRHTTSGTGNTKAAS